MVLYLIDKCVQTINAEVELSDMTFDSLMSEINKEEAVLA